MSFRRSPLLWSSLLACLVPHPIAGCSNDKPTTADDAVVATDSDPDTHTPADTDPDTTVPEPDATSDDTTPPSDTAPTDAEGPADTAGPADTDSPPDAETPADTAPSDTTPTDATPPDEIVRLRNAPCERTPNAASRCESFEITCGGAAATIVDVAVYEPRDGIQDRGVVLFGSGGGGTGYYNFPDRARLLGAGYTVLERRWLGDFGWFSDADGGPAQASCRLAALLRHYERTLARDLPLCATGNSGGSAELVYALTWHDAGAALAFAMPTSGPFHRLDLICQGQQDTAWVAAADALKAGYCPDCLGNRYQAGGGIITLIDASFGTDAHCSTPSNEGAVMLRNGSPDVGPSVPTLDATLVHLKVGKLDDGPFSFFVPALYEDLVDAGANVNLEFLDDVGHEMDQYEDGVTEIGDAILEHCR